jgi:hypothetical protein
MEEYQAHGVLKIQCGGEEGSCEHGDEPSGSIKCWEVLEWLYNWRLLKKGSALLVSKYVSVGVRTEFFWLRSGPSDGLFS